MQFAGPAAPCPRLAARELDPSESASALPALWRGSPLPRRWVWRGGEGGTVGCLARERKQTPCFLGFRLLFILHVYIINPLAEHCAARASEHQGQGSTL